MAANKRRTFVVASVVCGILFGIPFLISFARVLSAVHRWKGLAYSDMNEDVFWLIVLGAITFVPPTLFYLRGSEPSPKSPREAPPSSLAVKTDSPGDSRERAIIYTLVALLVYAVISVLYTLAMQTALPRYSIIDGAAVVGSWTCLIMGIVAAIRLKKGLEVLWGILFFFTALIPIAGIGGALFYFGWTFHKMTRSKVTLEEDTPRQEPPLRKPVSRPKPDTRASTKWLTQYDIEVHKDSIGWCLLGVTVAAILIIAITSSIQTQHRDSQVGKEVRQGASTNSRDAQGRTPLFVAAFDGRVATAQRLLYAGADPNIPDDEGRTPLIVAAKFNYGDVVRALLKAGAKTGPRDNEGKTALDWALDYEGETVDLLKAAAKKGQ